MLSSTRIQSKMSTDYNQVFKLQVGDTAGVSDYLTNLGFLQESEKIEKVETAGEGNMNVVLRVISNKRSFILKQSLPWVRKFPEVEAPVQRIGFENRFYQIVRSNETLRKFTPEIYFFDDDNLMLCFEDFGAAKDFTSIYRKGVEISKTDMADIARVVSELHFQFRTDKGLSSIENRELRALNHQHIFQLPLAEDNGLDLDSVLSGLQRATEKFRKDERLKAKAAELGNLYLNGEGTRLLHGDYYPGSWLKTDNGFRMIDPEFCFTGLPEFELGVAVAHLKMAQQKDSLSKEMFVYYHFDSRFDGGLFSKFAGIEVIRRIIGLAQLPLDLTLKERLDLLDEAYEWVVKG